MKPLLIEESPLLVSPSLAVQIGLNEAIVLQQIHYWLNPKHNKNFFDDRYWVWNTYAQWQEQFPFWSEMTIRRIIANLESLGLLLVTYRNGLQRSKFYTIDYLRVMMLTTEKPVGLSQEMTENSSQYEQNSLINMNRGSDQSEQDHLIKMNSSYIDTEITSETTPPPPTSSCEMSAQKEEEEESSQLKIKIWNRVVQKSLQPNINVMMTPKRQLALQGLEETLKSYGVSWEAYCEKIAGSRFLLGENPSGFRVSLDWALQPDKAIKILEGAIFDKKSSTEKDKIPMDTSWHAFSQELWESIPQTPYVNQWISLCQLLKDQLGEPTVRAWFMKTALMELDDDRAVIQVDNSFIQDYLQTHYDEAVLKVVQSQYPQVKRIMFKEKE